VHESKVVISRDSSSFPISVPGDAMSVVLGYKFAAIPEWVLYHPKLTGDDVRVFGIFARYGNDCRPSRGTVAKLIRKSTDTVDRCVARLAAVGAVIVEKRFEGETQLPNRYHLCGDQPFAEGSRTDAAGGGGTDAAGGAALVRHEREQDNESKYNEKPTSSSASPTAVAADEGFEDWWKLYPKKVNGKGEARKKWRAMKKAEKADAVAGIVRHVAWWGEHETDPTFIPAGNVWLNQRRWEDDEPRSAVPLKAVAGGTMMDRVRAKLTETQT